MRVAVIGGSGHIGTFLVPRLVRAGHDVINISRGTRTAYTEASEWQQVRQVVADREQEDGEGTFGDRVAGLKADVVIDLVCFTLDSARALVERLRGEAGHLLHCGTLWRYGPSQQLPISETTGTAPVGEYGIQKDRIARMLKEETASGGLVTTSLHPGHIVGPGWHPIGPVGNLDPAVWYALSAGEPLRIPGIGVESMHHVHADDVAQAFERAVEHRGAAAGEDFNVVAPTALNVRGYAHTAAGWFGQTASLEPVTWEQFRRTTAPDQAEVSWEHLYRSHCLTIEKARTLLDYAPRYAPETAVLESVRWLIDHDELKVARPLVD
ncbi:MULTISPECIES: NAD-dependent epimerase/dehydratase family protein [Streptomyces]|uniref:NAD(P)-dependent oxidoreductase n=1 Tax=Streptomyces griseiscabiei TaxID=2993540 RepID=A0ABU4LBR8_9ACTN|nr:MULTISPECIES: NAD(P)-dependent oxidoreductase [Streptomyces]MBZ3900214.1 NAD(P)-dependent oxidoreductase [Streptomyces griseiscabiei]MDX2913222.1 NAD(P)-dependent oxidoreductase [Streptomyces griseiscabiei]